MILSPDQLACLLALPLSARRRLLCAGQGRLYRDGDTCGVCYDHPPETLFETEAWAPADSISWMIAATPTGGWWQATHWSAIELEWIIHPDGGVSRIASATTAITCALIALKATHAQD